MARNLPPRAQYPKVFVPAGRAHPPELADVPVGTVDKFQGLEAPVVFYSMATSSAEDVPRTLDFLLSPNRLNVAVSRGRPPHTRAGLSRAEGDAASRRECPLIADSPIVAATPALTSLSRHKSPAPNAQQVRVMLRRPVALLGPVQRKWFVTMVSRGYRRRSRSS